MSLSRRQLLKDFGYPQFSLFSVTQLLLFGSTSENCVNAAALYLAALMSAAPARALDDHTRMKPSSGSVTLPSPLRSTAINSTRVVASPGPPVRPPSIFVFPAIARFAS